MIMRFFNLPLIGEVRRGVNFYNSKGYKVIRFWNNEIDENIEGVFLKLKQIFDIKD